MDKLRKEKKKKPTSKSSSETLTFYCRGGEVPGEQFSNLSHRLEVFVLQGRLRGNGAKFQLRKRRDARGQGFGGRGRSAIDYSTFRRGRKRAVEITRKEN